MKTYSKCMLCGVPIKWMTAEMAAKALYRAEVWVHYWGDGDYLLCDSEPQRFALGFNLLFHKAMVGKERLG